MRCQLCSYEFDENQLSCHSSCPLNDYCAIVCCPNCGYQAVDEAKSQLVGTMLRLFKRDPKSSPQAQSHSQAPLGTVHCPLSQVCAGGVGKLVAINSKKTERLERLQILGLTPGAKVILKQRQPEYVLQVGHTELTIEQSVADDVIVEVLKQQQL